MTLALRSSYLMPVGSSGTFKRRSDNTYNLKGLRIVQMVTPGTGSRSRHDGPIVAPGERIGLESGVRVIVRGPMALLKTRVGQPRA